MATPQIQVVVQQSKGKTPEVFDVKLTAASSGQPLRIKVQPGLKYQLKDLAREGQTAPEMVKVKRVGQDLLVMLEEGVDAPHVVLEGYYDAVPDGFSGLIGEAENGSFYEYIVESSDTESALTSLTEARGSAYSFLGNVEVADASGAALGVLAFNPLVAGAGALGAAAAGGGGGGGGGAAGPGDSGADVTALEKIASFAETGQVAPAVADYAAAGVNGVTDANLAAINSAINAQAGSDTAVGNANDREAADTVAEVQAIVNAYTAILAEANGSDADANAQDPSAAQYAAIGVKGVDAGAEEALLGDVIGIKNTGDVDSVSKVQALADAVQAVMEGNATQAQLEILGVTGVTQDNLAAVQAALTAANDATQLNTLAGLQAIVDDLNAAAAFIAAKAEDNTAATLNPADYAAAGVTGVTNANVSAINSALNTGITGAQSSATGVSGVEADSPAELQAIVDAYNKILASADGTDSNATATPTAADYAAIGVSVNDVTAELLSDVIDSKPVTAVDTAGDIQALADAAQAAVVYTGSNTAPTVAQLQALVTGVSDANLASVLAALADANTNTTGTNANQPVTQAELQALVNGINNALATIVAAAENNTGTSSAISPIIYGAAGVTGVTAANVGLINSLLDTTGVTGATVDSREELQDLVDAATKLNALANGQEEGIPLLDPNDIAALGLSNVINSPADLALFNQIVDNAPASTLTGDNPGAAVVNLASIADRLVLTAAGTTPISPALTAADLQAIGLDSVNPSFLSQYLAAVAATNDSGTGVDTLGELQDLVRDVNWANAQPVIAVAEATNGISADELADGIQTLVTLPADAAVGDTLTLTIDNNDGTPAVVTHVLTANDLAAGAASVVLSQTVVQTGGAVVDGDYTVTSQIAHANGATTQTASLSFTLDTTQPGLGVSTIAGDTVDASQNQFVGELDAAERGTSPTTLATPLVLSGVTDAEVGSTVYVTLNRTTYTTTVQAPRSRALMDNTWSVTVTDPDAIALNHGNVYEVIAQTSDKAGNPIVDNQFGLRTNTASPDVPTVNNTLTNDTTPILSGLARKLLPGADPAVASNYIALEASDTLTVIVNGVTISGTIASLPTGLSYNATTQAWSLDTAAAGVTLTDGTYDVQVTTTAGNVTKEDASAAELIINTQPPVVTLNPLSGDDRINAIENDSAVVLTGTTDADVGSDVLVTLNGTSYTAQVLAGTTPGSNLIRVTIPASAVALLPEGDVDYSVAVTNAFGSQATVSRTVDVDTLAPLAPTVTLAEAADLRVNATELSDGLQVSVSLPAGTQAGETLTVSVTDPLGIVRQFSHTVTNAEATAGTSILNVPKTTTSADGAYSLTATLTDLNGNLGAAANNVSFTLDTVVPGQNANGTTSAAAPAWSTPSSSTLPLWLAWASKSPTTRAPWPMRPRWWSSTATAVPHPMRCNWWAAGRKAPPPAVPAWPPATAAPGALSTAPTTWPTATRVPPCSWPAA